MWSYLQCYYNQIFASLSTLTKKPSTPHFSKCLMQQSSPRLWPNSPSNSPLPLPASPILYTLNECFVVKSPPLKEMDSMKLPALREWIGGHTLPDGSKINDTINLDQCVPMLLIGELSNPCRLNDNKIEKSPKCTGAKN